MKINLINKEITKGKYHNTVIHKTEESFNESTDGIYIDYERNLIKLKNNSISRYTWLEFYIPKLIGVTEFYVTYEIRNCTGEPVKFSIEKDKITRKNFIVNESSEWVKHKIKLIHNENSGIDVKTSHISIGNTENTIFSAEIRNIEVEMIRNNHSEYNAFFRYGGKLRPLLNTKPIDYYSGKSYKIFTFNLEKNPYESLCLLLFSQAIVRIYNISTFQKTVSFNQINIYREYTEHLNFYSLKKENGEVDIYVKILTNRVSDRDLVIFHESNFIFDTKFPIVQEEDIPIEATQLTPLKFKTLEVSIANSLNTPYMVAKLEQEGLYDDFIMYMDDIAAYNKEKKLKEEIIIAYEKEVEESPELTYKEFTSSLNTKFNFTEEPQPSKALEDFIKRYL